MILYVKDGGKIGYLQDKSIIDVGSSPLVYDVFVENKIVKYQIKVPNPWLLL